MLFNQRNWEIIRRLGAQNTDMKVKITPMLAYPQTSGLSGIMPQQRITAAMRAKLTEHVEAIAEFGLDKDYNGQTPSPSAAHHAGTRLILKW